jgi:hypothetical protein
VNDWPLWVIGGGVVLIVVYHVGYYRGAMDGLEKYSKRVNETLDKVFRK